MTKEDLNNILLLDKQHNSITEESPTDLYSSFINAIVYGYKEDLEVSDVIEVA